MATVRCRTDLEQRLRNRACMSIDPNLAPPQFARTLTPPGPARLPRCAPGPTEPTANRLLGALTESAFQRLLPDLEMVDMPLGMVLWESGRPATHAYFPTTSIVARMCGLEDGRSGAVFIVGNEGLVGLPVLMGDGEPLGHMVVLSPGRGYRLRAAALNAEFEMGGPTTQLLLRYIQALMTQLGQTVACTRHHCLERRLCRFLLSILDRLDGGTDFVMTQELMGGALGVRREGVTEVAMKLQRAGILAYQRGHVTVLDRVGLKQRSCECHDAVSKEYLRLLPVHWGQ
jgi:CRP-like cAMP-binding protein